MLFSVQIVTNGIYKSTEHRAIVNNDKERISIATFLSPKLDGDLGPAPSLLNVLQNLRGLEWPITSRDISLERLLENHMLIL